MSDGRWGEKHALFKQFKVNEEVHNEDGALIAKLLKVEDGGKRMQIAVLDLIDEECIDLGIGNACHGQTIEDVNVDCDANEEGKRVLKIEGPYPDELQRTANNLCFHIYIALRIIKREKDWERLRDACRFCVRSDAYKKKVAAREEDVETLYQSRRKKFEDEHRRYHAYVAELVAAAEKKKLEAEKGSKGAQGGGAGEEGSKAGRGRRHKQ